MKNLINQFTLLGLLVLALCFTACQEEFEEVGEDTQETITRGSTVAQLMINTAANDGSFDNIIDASSCTAIKFPYTVAVAGVEITIDSSDDFKTIEEIFDEFDGDEDVLDIIFPITLSLADFTEVVINSKEALLEWTADCVEGGADQDIECVDFSYPITLFTFNVTGQQAGSVTIKSDKELQSFFKDKGTADLVSIDFPVNLINYDGSQIQVNSNMELSQALEAAKESCDEDDDNDYNDDDFEEDAFADYLVECPWQVSMLKRDATDQSEQYTKATLNFDSGGTLAYLDHQDVVANGEWRLAFTPDGPKLEIAFEDLPDFNALWTVYEIGTDKIKFFVDDNNKIVLQRDCDGPGPAPCQVDAIAEKLESGCAFKITDTNVALNFDGTIDFSNRNIHAFMANGAFADEGNWELLDNGFRFNALAARLENLIGDWSVTDCGDNWVKLTNDQDAFIVLEKDCEAIVPYVDALKDTLTACEWVIQKITSEGVQEDRLLGHEFDFDQTGVTLSDGIVTKEGNWEIGMGNDGQLNLLVNIPEEFAVGYNWPLAELTNNRLRFGAADAAFELVLERVCDDNAADDEVTSIQDILLGGLWQVERFQENDMDNTEAYAGIDFSFSNMHQVEVSRTDDPLASGLWRVIRNSEGKLEAYLNFSAPGNNFAPLTAIYKIVELSDNLIELRYETEEETKILVFTKA